MQLLCSAILGDAASLQLKVRSPTQADRAAWPDCASLLPSLHVSASRAYHAALAPQCLAFTY